MIKGLSSCPRDACWVESHQFISTRTLKPLTSESLRSRTCRVHSLTIKASLSATQLPELPPLVVVGSANADIFLEIERVPNQGETISTFDGFTLPGGKGANQAACAAKLSYPTYFVGQVGDDSNGNLITDRLKECGVRVDYVRTVAGVPTGSAVVMLQPGGQNSIIICGGANMRGWPNHLLPEDLDIVRNAGIILLQREIPDSVNIQVAEAARTAGVPVILDAGGMDLPLPPKLLAAIDFLSPNESELSRITGMQTDTMERIHEAIMKCYEMGVKKILLKLGDRGSALFVKDEMPIFQPIIPATRVVDTTGAGDTFTAAFAVAFLEGKPKPKCLQFASAAASVCIQEKGAMPSMPDRRSVLNRVLRC